MKLILLNPVPSLGEKGAVVQVRDGYARNFLLPKKLAQRWSSEAEAKLERAAARRTNLSNQIENELTKTVQTLSQLELQFLKKVTSKGALYGSVKPNEVSRAIFELSGISINPEQIKTKSPIKQLGESFVEIDLDGQAVAKVKIIVNKTE
jgi:large subunit ribosomal protein L9